MADKLCLSLDKVNCFCVLCTETLLQLLDIFYADENSCILLKIKSCILLKIKCLFKLFGVTLYVYCFSSSSSSSKDPSSLCTLPSNMPSSIPSSFYPMFLEPNNTLHFILVNSVFCFWHSWRFCQSHFITSIVSTALISVVSFVTCQAVLHWLYWVAEKSMYTDQYATIIWFESLCMPWLHDQCICMCTLMLDT